MATRAVMREALASLVCAMSAAGFLVVLSAVAVTSGPLSWAPWRRVGLGWRFWMTLGNMGAAIALASLIGCLALAACGRAHLPSNPKRIGLYALLNVVTLVLLMFVPAVAARW